MAQAETKVLETRFGPPPAAQPVVSVLMITYNHERFIREAIQSVFAQEVDFPIELIIGEDCSTDNTRAIVNQVCEGAKFPVYLLSASRNLGMHDNFRRTLESCKGEFVALIEGDDQWLGKDKLKIQVAALLADKKKSFCYHRSKSKIIGHSEEQQMRRGHSDGTIWPEQEIVPASFENVIGRFLIPTASVVFRRALFPTLPHWCNQLPWCDWPLYLLLLDKGDAIFLPIVRSIYCVHAGGVSELVNEKKYHRGAALTYLGVAGGMSRSRRILCTQNALMSWSNWMEANGSLSLESLMVWFRILGRSRESIGLARNAIGRFIFALSPKIFSLLSRARHSL